MWALGFAMQFHRDVRVITGRVPLLDPSAYSLMSRPEERSFPPPVGSSGILIDAARKGPYPPVGLPKRAFMEQALQIWQGEGLPSLKLNTPWYGYPLRLWKPEDDDLAEQVAKKYFYARKKRKGRRRIYDEAGDDVRGLDATRGDSSSGRVWIGRC